MIDSRAVFRDAEAECRTEEDRVRVTGVYTDLRVAEIASARAFYAD